MEVVKKNVAVIGSRKFQDKALLERILTLNHDRIKLIVSGGAQGPDTMGVEWATKFGIPYLVFPALWRDPFTQVLDRGAGFRRNRLIIKNCDIVLAFMIKGGSNGTKHSLEIAKELGKDVKIYEEQ